VFSALVAVARSAPLMQSSAPYDVSVEEIVPDYCSV